MRASWQSDDFELDVPAELETGAYANVLVAWHTADEFTLDFGTFVAAETERQPRTVARVKVPPGAVFDMIRIIHSEMTKYEEKFGPIHYPRREENE
jgi:hypothetical protein